MAETIYLKPLTTWEKAQKTRETLPAPLKILTSLKTTAVLGGILGGLLLGPAAIGRGALAAAKFVAPKTLKQAVGAAIVIPTAYGVLRKSPKAREVVSKTLDPREAVKRGEYIAGIIEDPKKIEEIGKEEGWWSTLKSAAKKGGPYAAGAAAIVGVAALAKKPVQTYLEKRKAAKELGLTETAARETGLVSNDLPRAPVTLRQPYVPLPSEMPTSISPIQAPQQQLRRPPIQNIIQIQLR